MKMISLLRHGITESIAVFPAADARLSAEGLSQMRARLPQLESVDAIISSPYLRCAQFAEVIANEKAIELQQDSRLAEFNFGDWIGQPHALLAANPNFTAFQAAPFNSASSAALPKNSEGFSDFSARILEVINDIQNSKAQHCLLITHGGVIRFILLHVLQMPISQWYRIRVDFASLTQLNMTDDGWIEVLAHQGTRP